MASHQIHSGVLSPERVPQLLSRLDGKMPYSIGLARRIQFHLDHPSPTARVFVAATEAPKAAEVTTTDDDVWLDGWLKEENTPSSAPWIAAHVDLVGYGQTQVWVFGSWEADRPTGHDTTRPIDHDANEDSDRHLTKQALMNRLFRFIHVELVPDMPASPDDGWLELERTGKYLTKPYSRNKILFGAVADGLWRYFDKHAQARTDGGYKKYIFTLDRDDEEAKLPTELSRPPRLPHGYSFDQMRNADLQMVCDRTPIPKSVATLAQLVSVSLLYNSHPIPVGWGFLGKDASISSLHVEPDHRGKGLAVHLSRELLRRQGRGFQTVGAKGQTVPLNKSGFAHADVSESNTASRRVMEKLGGRPLWMVMWTEVDLEKVDYGS